MFAPNMASGLHFNSVILLICAGTKSCRWQISFMTVRRFIKTVSLDFAFAAVGEQFLCQHLSKKLEQICSGMTERIFSMTDRCMRIHMLQDIDRQLIQEFNAIPLYQNVLQVTSSENVKGLMLDEEGWIDLYSVWLSK